MSEITTERHYKITLSDGSTYYGRTTLLGNRRYTAHKVLLRKGTHSTLQEVYDKYGYDDWVHEWLGYETGDLEHHRKIEFGYVQADPKSLNIHDGKYTLLSEDEKKEYFRLMEEERLKELTPEEYKEYRQKENSNHKRKWDNMTPEEKRLHRKRTEEGRQRRINNMTPEELEEYRREQREYSQRKRDEKKQR